MMEMTWVAACIFASLFIVTTANTTPDTSPADTCASHPCENGGQCISLPNAFICRCTEEYSGLRCETHSSEQGQTACTSMPCLRGECVSTGPQQFTCMCPSEWRGPTCEIDVDECMSSPCLNGASCQNVDGGYSCQCAVGFAGPNCEQDITCATNICSNNGTCLSENGQSVCLCPESFTGNICQDQVGCSANPCKNGHCLPSDEDPNGYVCNCHAGYTARLCDRLLYAACSHNGDTFYDGEIRIVRCNQCHCRSGEWLCTRKFCGSILVMFDFIGDYNAVVQGNEDVFKSSLRSHLAEQFSIEEDMVDNLVVSAGSIHVEFELVPLVESHLNIEDVAAEMLARLESDTFYFRFGEASLFVDTSSVKLEKVEPTTEEPMPPAISNVTLVIVCVLVSLLLIVAVVIGTVVIIVHRKRSEKTSTGQFRGREEKEEYPMNNRNHTRHHNDLYSHVPNDNSSTASGDLKDINIAMFKVADPNDSKSGLDHV